MDSSALEHIEHQHGPVMILLSLSLSVVGRQCRSERHPKIFTFTGTLEFQSILLHQILSTFPIFSPVFQYHKRLAPKRFHIKSQASHHPELNGHIKYSYCSKPVMTVVMKRCHRTKPPSDILCPPVHLLFSKNSINILNHPQWTGGYLNDVASNGYTTSRNDLIPGNGYFGRFDQFYSSNSRTGQITAHITF